MKRLIPAWGAVAIALVFAMIAAAQGTGRLNGEILDKEGKPFADVIVEIRNPDTGQAFTLKTDKNGKFVQIGLRSGVYSITIISVKDNLNYPVKFQVNDGQENEFKLDFKQLMAETAASHPEEVKKKEEDANKFKNMKLHFDNGVAAMTNADNLAKQIKTAPADQKSALQQSRVSECTTAIAEFTDAEQGVGPKEINNHATVWANLGAAYDCASKYDDSIAAFQKAIDIKPQANYYAGLATGLAKVATAQKDPKVTEAKLAEANANCEKAIALDAAGGAGCWKNLGIVLTNKSPKDAVVPLQKAAQADPKDAQTWYLLGGAYAANIDSKQQGEKLIYIIPDGAKEAYQKCIDVDPNGPYAKMCKETLDGLNALAGGEETIVGKKKKK